MKIKRYRIVKEMNGCYRGEYRFIFIPFWWYIDESITMSLEECERYVTNYINNGHAGFVKYMPILLILSLASCDSGEQFKEDNQVDTAHITVSVATDTLIEQEMSQQDKLKAALHRINLIREYDEIKYERQLLHVEAKDIELSHERGNIDMDYANKELSKLQKREKQILRRERRIEFEVDSIAKIIN